MTYNGVISGKWVDSYSSVN